MDDGVLCGHLMLHVTILFSFYLSTYLIFYQVAKHIFQGPSAALEHPGYHRGKRGNASLMGMISMTPHAIAYVAVQVKLSFLLAAYTKNIFLDPICTGVLRPMGHD